MQHESTTINIYLIL